MLFLYSARCTERSQELRRFMQSSDFRPCTLVGVCIVVTFYRISYSDSRIPCVKNTVIFTKRYLGFNVYVSLTGLCGFGQ